MLNLTQPTLKTHTTPPFLLLLILFLYSFSSTPFLILLLFFVYFCFYSYFTSPFIPTFLLHLLLLFFFYSSFCFYFFLEFMAGGQAEVGAGGHAEVGSGRGLERAGTGASDRAWASSQAWVRETATLRDLRGLGQSRRLRACLSETGTENQVQTRVGVKWGIQNNEGDVAQQVER